MPSKNDNKKIVVLFYYNKNFIYLKKRLDLVNKFLGGSIIPNLIWPILKI